MPVTDSGNMFSGSRLSSSPTHSNLFARGGLIGAGFYLREEIICGTVNF